MVSSKSQNICNVILTFEVGIWLVFNMGLLLTLISSLPATQKNKVLNLRSKTCHDLSISSQLCVWKVCWKPLQAWVSHVTSTFWSCDQHIQLGGDVELVIGPDMAILACWPCSANMQQESIPIQQQVITQLSSPLQYYKSSFTNMCH